MPFKSLSLQEVKDLFSKSNIHIVIMGAGIPIEERLEIVRFIFETSKGTTVLMKDWNSRPTGMLPFVNGVL